MDGKNPEPSRSLYFELKFAGCSLTVTLQLIHGADCKKHCFVCMPELRERLKASRHCHFWQCQRVERSDRLEAALAQSIQVRGLRCPMASSSLTTMCAFASCCVCLLRPILLSKFAAKLRTAPRPSKWLRNCGPT